MLGSLAGIGEIAKATFGSGDGSGGAGGARRRHTGAAQADRAGDAGFTTPGYTPPRHERA